MAKNQSMSPYSDILVNILPNECLLAIRSGAESVDIAVQRHTGKYLGEWMVVGDAQ